MFRDWVSECDWKVCVDRVNRLGEHFTIDFRVLVVMKSIVDEDDSGDGSSGPVEGVVPYGVEVRTVKERSKNVDQSDAESWVGSCRDGLPQM